MVNLWDHLMRRQQDEMTLQKVVLVKGKTRHTLALLPMTLFHKDQAVISTAAIQAAEEHHQLMETLIQLINMADH